MASRNLLSVIVPFSVSDNRRNSLNEWLPDALKNLVEVIVVVDGDEPENIKAISEDPAGRGI